MTPATARRILANQLRRNGQDITLERVTGTENQVKFAATVRAFPRKYAPEALLGGLQQGETVLAINPADLERLQWPAALPGAPLLARLPMGGDPGDGCYIAGKRRTIRVAVPIMAASTLIRFDLVVRG